MAIAIIVIKQYKNSNEPAPKPKITNSDKPKDPASNPTSRDRGFDRRTSYLEYSNAEHHISNTVTMLPAVCSAGRYQRQR